MKDRNKIKILDSGLSFVTIMRGSRLITLGKSYPQDVADCGDVIRDIQLSFEGMNELDR